MSFAYAIQWRSRVNGIAGKGTKLFQREEAEHLARELNREYPQIEHEVISVEPGGEYEMAKPGSEGEPAKSEETAVPSLE